MMTRGTAALTTGLLVVVLVLLARVVTRGWVDYLLLALILGLLIGSYRLRRHVRSGMYHRVRTRTR